MVTDLDLGRDFYKNIIEITTTKFMGNQIHSIQVYVTKYYEEMFRLELSAKQSSESYYILHHIDKT